LLLLFLLLVGNARVVYLELQRIIAFGTRSRIPVCEIFSENHYVFQY